MQNKPKPFQHYRRLRKLGPVENGLRAATIAAITQHYGNIDFDLVQAISRLAATAQARKW